MSRSLPDERLPHPCQMWLEWNGEKGNLRYWDKQNKKRVEIPIPFQFILLDQLAGIRGWSDKRQSGIYSNEVKDTRSEPLIVKDFKGGKIVEGLYADIKDTVIDSGGHFMLGCYMAFPLDNTPATIGCTIGCIQFKGVSLNAWMEFEKKNRPQIWKYGIAINDVKTGKKGAITFKTPVFEIVEIDKDLDDQATERDRQLQTYLRSYFKREKVEPVQQEEEYVEKEEESDIPF